MKTLQVNSVISTNESFWQANLSTTEVFLPGDLVRIKKSVLQDDNCDGIGIIIKNSSVQLAYEQGYCDEWTVYVNGDVVQIPAQNIWPLYPEDDYLKYINTDFIEK